MAVLEAEVTASLSDRAWQHYYRLRPQIETPENIGKLILFDLDSGDYEIAEDHLGFDAAASVRQRHPDADMFCMRIGYDVSCTLSGSMERLPT
jgi:hypothetical protein